MNINQKIQRQLKIQKSIFYILLLIAIVLIAQLSLKTDISADWTENSRHTLSDTTISILNALNTDVTIQAFISPDHQYFDMLKTQLSRYQSYTKRLHIDYINPEFSPDLVRKYAIQQEGEMVVSRDDQQSHVFDLSEQSLTNAIISVSHTKEQWLVFIEGHGERTPLSQENYNLSIWGEQLKQKGIKFQALNLVEHSQIPKNTAALVIASPERAWLPGEINIVKTYIKNGGNLLWLADPQTHQYLSALAEQLNITFINGTVIDPNTQPLGIDDPRFSLINNYANHPISEAVKSVTLFPQAVALQTNDSDNIWQATALLTTPSNAWSKLGLTSEKQKDYRFQQGIDTQGPLSIGYLLTRTLTKKKDKQQRIAIIGDSDFVSNTYIANASNAELANAIAHWLVGDDDLITIPMKVTQDNSLVLSQTQSIIIGLGFLIALPLMFFFIGLIIWRKRRQR